jgi:hypothetical protein
MQNRSIRLSDERFQHLETDHPEMTGQTSRIAETLGDPDCIVRSRANATVELFYKWYVAAPVTEKFLCVVVKALPDDPLMTTACHTDLGPVIACCGRIDRGHTGGCP